MGVNFADLCQNKEQELTVLSASLPHALISKLDACNTQQASFLEHFLLAEEQLILCFEIAGGKQ